MEYKWYQRIQIWFIKTIARIKWSPDGVLSEDDDVILKDKFVVDYYIIATRKSNYLTTFFIALGNFLLTGKWGFYSHVLMNLEDQVDNEKDYRFIEATGVGTHYSTFEDVFGHVDAVALIKPKGLTLKEWTDVLDRARSYLGRPYDNLFNLKNDLEINCVELIQLALKALPDYDTRFSKFEELANRTKKITPDMFVNCPDFEVVYRIKR